MLTGGDVGFEYGIDVLGVFGIIDHHGKRVPVLGIADDEKSLGNDVVFEVEGELCQVLVVVPRVAACHLGIVQRGQHQLCRHLAESIAGVVSPFPHAGVDAADAVCHSLTGVTVQECVVGRGVSRLALLIDDITRDGGPVGVDACCGAGDDALDFKIVGICQILPIGVLHSPRQHRLALGVDADLQVLRMVDYLGGLFLRRNLLCRGVAFSIHHAGVDIHVLPRAVGREVSLAHQRFLQTLAVGLSRQLVGVVEVGRLHAACGDAVGEHQFVDVFALHRYHGVVDQDRHFGCCRTIPLVEQCLETALVLVVRRHIIVVVAVFDVCPHFEFQCVPAEFVGHCPDDGGLEVVPATVAVRHIVTDLPAVVGKRLGASLGFACQLEGACLECLDEQVSTLIAAVDIVIGGSLPVEEVAPASAIYRDVNVPLADSFVEKRTPVLRRQRELDAVFVNHHSRIVRLFLHEVVGLDCRSAQRQQDGYASKLDVQPLVISVLWSVHCVYHFLEVNMF